MSALDLFPLILVNLGKWGGLALGIVALGLCGWLVLEHIQIGREIDRYDNDNR
jgi:hypothetical protein